MTLTGRGRPVVRDPDRAAGRARREYRTLKFGSWERSLQLDAQAAVAGAGEGTPFAFDRIERTPNTLAALRLIGLAGEAGVQGAVVEGLFRAYLTEGRDIGTRPTLLDVAAEAGLDRAKAEGVLTGDGGQEAIRDAADRARRLRVGGVPFFVIHERVTLSGAQPPEAFLSAFKQALDPRP